MAVGDAEREQMIFKFFTEAQIESQRSRDRRRKKNIEPALKELTLPWPAVQMVSRADHMHRLKVKSRTR